MMSGKFEVHLVNEESTQEFDVLFEGPAESNSIAMTMTEIEEGQQ